MKDDDARRLEVLSTEGRLFGKRECALLPHWSPTTRRRHAQETLEILTRHAGGRSSHMDR